jgi:hypothetical protein
MVNLDYVLRHELVLIGDVKLVRRTISGVLGGNGAY